MTRTASTHRPRQPHTATMLAATIAAPRSLRLQRVAVPEPARGQVRVRLQGCGVCASNIPPWQGRPWFSYPLAPGQLGHEGWGIIDAVGSDVPDLQPGQRVALISEHAFAEYDIATPASIVRLPESLNDKPVPAEPLGCLMNILARSNIQPHHRVAVVGIGFLGALLVQQARRTTARVSAFSQRRASLNLAQRMGAEHTIALEDDTEPAIEQATRLTRGGLFDVVIEATGKATPLQLAGALTAQRGRLVIAGFHQDGPRTIDLQMWNWRGIDVINAHERDPAVYRVGMERAVAALHAGTLDPWDLYTHRFALDRLDDALDLTAERPGSFVKALIDISQPLSNHRT